MLQGRKSKKIAKNYFQKNIFDVQEKEIIA